MSIYEIYIFANISNALRLVPDDAVQSGKYYSFFLGNTQPNLFVLNWEIGSANILWYLHAVNFRMKLALCYLTFLLCVWFTKADFDEEYDEAEEGDDENKFHGLEYYERMPHDVDIR